MQFSRRVKLLLQDESYQTVFPDTVLDPNNQSTEEWGIAGKRGAYVAAGIGGGIQWGAHTSSSSTSDQNAEEADGANTRESIWDWYGSTAYTPCAGRRRSGYPDVVA